MATTRNDINVWLTKFGNKDDHSHMIVVTDTYDYEDYPVFVARGTDIHAEIEKQKAKSMVKVTEVYSYDQPLASQLNAHRAWSV